jgi:hypothetical protein
MDLLRGGFLLDQDAPDLWAVAVGDHDLPTVGGDVGDPLGGATSGAVHLLIGVLGAAAEQRVAAQGDHDALHRASYRTGARMSASCGESGSGSRS